jgi:preprotein translocase subunit YajC
MNILSNVLLQAADPVAGGGGGSFMSILMIVAMIAIFYFFMIRPQQKRQKDIQKAREAMKTGDKVVTAGGIHGRIKEVGENSMLIEIAEGVRIRVDKASIYASPEDIQHKV